MKKKSPAYHTFRITLSKEAICNLNYLISNECSVSDMIEHLIEEAMPKHMKALNAKLRKIEKGRPRLG